MKRISGIGLTDVQAVYGGPEGDLWELIMGEQIHIGGMASSLDLAEKAAIAEGSAGVDFCCCSGAGMRFLIRFRRVARMTGVDATLAVIERGRQRCRAENLDGKIQFVQADVCRSGLAAEMCDFVWGEDAWCYVADKESLIAEAARIVKPGGTIAFTDWIEGEKPLSDAEAERYMKFMKFPTIHNISDYKQSLQQNGCNVDFAQYTGRFAPHVDLYLNMLNMQLTYDALKIIHFDMELMQALAGEMVFLQKLAHEGKIAQGLFVAKKKK